MTTPTPPQDGTAMTKTPIDPSEIRKGDLLRAEGPLPSKVSAVEYTAMRDGDTWGPSADSHFLLDRPAPPVDLPTKPTLGWLEADGVRGLDVWRLSRDGGTIDFADLGSSSLLDGVRPKFVTAFTPAVAVPAEALEQLRRTIPFCRPEDVQDFLTAVDSANGASR